MPDLVAHIGEMLRATPKDEGLYAVLEDLQSSAQFAAPSAIPFWAKETAHALDTYIPEMEHDRTPWEQEVIRIWMHGPRS